MDKQAQHRQQWWRAARLNSPANRKQGKSMQDKKDGARGEEEQGYGDEHERANTLHHPLETLSHSPPRDSSQVCVPMAMGTSTRE